MTKTVETSVKSQYYATFCVNLISLAHGTAIGWTSPFLPILQSEETPLESGPITNIESSWIGSILCLGAIFGTFLFGWMADRFGRKISACVVALPQMASWLCIMFAKDVITLYVSRLLVGIAGGGVFVLVPLYVSEISEVHIRGSMGSILIFGINLGILVTFVLGNYLPYYTVQIILFFIPVLFLVAFLFLPETPAYLMKKNRIKEAELSLKYFRGLADVDVVCEKIELELSALQTNNKNTKTDSETASGFDYSIFRKNSTHKALIIGITLITVNQMSGCFALINYTAQIFRDAGANLDPNISAIIVGVIQIAGSCGSTYFVDKTNRKVLYIISAVGTGIGLAAMATFSYLQSLEYDVSSFAWIPLVSLSVVIFIASVGILPLAFIVLSEILPQQIRSSVSSFCVAYMWIGSFLVIKYFSSVLEILGMHGSMFLFSGCCFAGVFFFGLFVPETKGKSLETILDELS